jgi:hypothetical protein
MYRFYVVALFAGAGGFACADSGVELSGVIDGGITYECNSDENEGNRRGVRDLSWCAGGTSADID